MSRPVRVMSWDDAGAPQRSPANAAAIIDILKKCLVDGYGDTEPLGWTLPYEDIAAGIAVFRNSPVNGSGGYARISPYNIPGNAYILTQSAMSATGTAAADLFNPGYLNSIPTDATLTRWVLVGDDVSFYFILHHTSQNYAFSNVEICMFFGDINAVVPTDVARFICTGANATSTSSTLTVNTVAATFGPLSSQSGRGNLLTVTLSGDSVRNRLGFPASVSGVAGYNSYLLFVAGEPPESQPNATVSNVDFPVGAMIQPVAVKRDIALTAANMVDSNLPYIRGYMPGLVCPLFRTHYGSTWPLVQSIDGVTYLGIALNSSTSNYSGVLLWVNTEDWG